MIMYMSTFRIISENLTDPETGLCMDKDFVRLCELTNMVYAAMLDADLAEAQKKLPPHYTYLPSVCHLIAHIHLLIDPYLYKYENVGLFVCSRFSWPFRNRDMLGTKLLFSPVSVLTQKYFK